MTPDREPSLRISRLHVPVTALGPGRRIGIWLQGCGIGCPGCISRDTWDPRAAEPVSVAEVVADCLAALDADPLITGLTISGGEPSEQAEPVAALVDAVRVAGFNRGREIDVLLYSGLSWSALRRRHPELTRSADLIIPGPFIAARAPGGPWCGSSNQELQVLTQLGARRLAEQPAPTAGKTPLQVVVADGQLWTIGVPRPGDLDRALARAADAGVKVGGLSWLT
ncbi:MAG TPA: 4Fe-4S single cluster domain-containing protein [Actinomycetota bacterium]|nr:4Fe-4S single cluster domain-containing protein [Actinomycetota bacterium]